MCFSIGVLWNHSCKKGSLQACSFPSKTENCPDITFTYKLLLFIQMQFLYQVGIFENVPISVISQILF